MLDKIMVYLPVALTVIGAASVAVKAIAPLTKTKVDDKLGGALTKLVNLLGKLALNPKA